MQHRVFRWHHRVSYAECTVGNHVYYSRYLDILEKARGEFFRELGTTFVQWQNGGIAFPVIDCHMHFLGAGRYDDVLVIELWVSFARKVRLNFAYRVLGPTGLLLLEAETKHVCTSLSEKPRRLPDELAALLVPFIADAIQVGGDSVVRDRIY